MGVRPVTGRPVIMSLSPRPSPSDRVTTRRSDSTEAYIESAGRQDSSVSSSTCCCAVCLGAWVRGCAGDQASERADARALVCGFRLCQRGKDPSFDRFHDASFQRCPSCRHCRAAAARPAQASRTAIAPRVSGDSLGLTPVRGIETPGPMVRASRSYA